MSEDWVVDSLVGFLQTPVWNSPVNDFIEENCVVFDPGDENKLAYSQAHSSYRSLVEKLLSDFTTELGITAEQLAQACVQSGTLGGSHQKQLEQVLAVENFPLFKSLMVQKNIDLELQALKLLKSQLGHAPEAYDPEIPQPTAPLQEDFFQQAMEESQREFEAQNSLDEEEMKKLIALAKQESLRLFQVSEREKQAKVESSQTPVDVKEESKSSHVKASTPESKDSANTNIFSPQKSPQQAPLLPLSPKHTPSSTMAPSAHKGSISTSEAASMWLQSAKEEFRQSDVVEQKVAVQVPADLKSREAYLKRQRDHLLNVKRKARAKELDTYNTAKAPHKKPSSLPSPPVMATPGPSAEKEATTPEKATAPGTAGEKKKVFNTGVLCTVIADKLKEQHI